MGSSLCVQALHISKNPPEDANLKTTKFFAFFSSVILSMQFAFFELKDHGWRRYQF